MTMKLVQTSPGVLGMVDARGHPVPSARVITLRAGEFVAQVQAAAETAFAFGQAAGAKAATDANASVMQAVVDEVAWGILQPEAWLAKAGQAWRLRVRRPQ